jgi:hypothetical protein
MREPRGQVIAGDQLIVAISTRQGADTAETVQDLIRHDRDVREDFRHHAAQIVGFFIVSAGRVRVVDLAVGGANQHAPHKRIDEVDTPVRSAKIDHAAIQRLVERGIVVNKMRTIRTRLGDL